MATYSVAKAKDGLSRLIAEAEAGERVVITRHGKAAVELRVITESADAPGPDEDIYEWLAKRRATRPPAPMSSVELLDELRGN